MSRLPLNRTPPIDPSSEDYEVPQQFRELFSWMKKYKSSIIEKYTLNTEAPTDLIKLNNVYIPQVGASLLAYIKTRDPSFYIGEQVLKDELDAILDMEWSPDLSTQSRQFIDFYFNGPNRLSINPAHSVEATRVLQNSALPRLDGI